MTPVFLFFTGFVATFFCPSHLNLSDLRDLPFANRYDVLNYSSVLSTINTRRRQLIDDETSSNNVLSLSFFEQKFTIVLLHDSETFHNAHITVGDQILLDDRNLLDHLVSGYVKGYPNSKVLGSLIHERFYGRIILDITNESTTEETMYFVEPSSYFFKDKIDFHSIIYKGSDVHIPDNVDKSRRRRSKRSVEKTFSLCASSLQRISDVHNSVNNARRVARSASDDNRPGTSSANRRPRPLLYQSTGTRVGNWSERVCNLYLQSDTFLWDYVITLPHVKGNRDLAVREITSIFAQNVQGAQDIYNNAVFRDDSGQIEYHGIDFRVDRIRINVTEIDCKLRPRPRKNPASISSDRPSVGSYADENPFCNPNIDVLNFLNLHSLDKHDDFCLAYVFTYREFVDGTLGLAWVAGSDRSGGVCGKHREIKEDGIGYVHKSLNTGVVTLLNYGNRVASRVSQLTFAHELGHNLGAEHDSDQCNPSPNDPRGNYIMFARATSGTKLNNDKFSTCSINSIARLLDHIINSNENCFIKSSGPFCGNQLTEEGEQCDCGYSQDSCFDKCCHPAKSSAPCKLTDSVTVNNSNFKVHCSPTAGECCTPDCQFQPHTHMCRPSDECYHQAYCDASSAQCPASVNKPDRTPCQNKTRVCKSGQCIGSICERIEGWSECSLARSSEVTPEMLCYVACQKEGTPCISISQLKQNTTLQRLYPQLTSEFNGNDYSTILPAGSPCDNYRGYCDVLHRCRPINAMGPLSRLHDLLFSPRVLEKIRTWIIMHWWAVMLIILFSIILMTTFLKLFAKNTQPRGRQSSAANGYYYPPRPLHPALQPCVHNNRDGDRRRDRHDNRRRHSPAVDTQLHPLVLVEPSAPSAVESTDGGRKPVKSRRGALGKSKNLPTKELLTNHSTALASAQKPNSRRETRASSVDSLLSSSLTPSPNSSTVENDTLHNLPSNDDLRCRV